MKYALIGCGRVSHNHIKAAVLNKLDIVALCDITLGNIDINLSQFSDDLKNVPRYEDYKKMLAEQKPELVAIATESGKHADIAVYCIEHGCNVIIEKPIALSIKDADRIIEAAKANNVKVCNNFQNRFNDASQLLKKAVDDGRFGKITYGTAQIRWHRGDDYYGQASWRGTWAQDGGTLMNQCIHDIDLLCWMMGGEVSEIIGMTDRLVHPQIEAEDLGMAIIKFKNGAYGVVEGTTNINPKSEEETLMLFGEHGTAKLGGISAQIVEHWRFDDELDNEDEIKKDYGTNPTHIYGLGHTTLYTDMLGAIADDRAPLADAYAGKRALEVVLAIYKAAAEGSVVKLPLKECSTMDFCGRF